MSAEGLELMNVHREAQLSLSPSSEIFTLDTGTSFYGIFDDSHIEKNADGGHITQKDKSPRIMVDVVPDGIIERATKIYRGTQNTYTVKFIGKDDAGVPVIWLY